MSNIHELIAVMKVGRFVLDDMKKTIGEDNYNKILSEPIKSCSCGFIKEGDESSCPKCELNQDVNTAI